MPWLINAAQLDKFRKNPKNVVVLDASWHLPSEKRQAHEEFLNSHIAGAKFFNFADFYDVNTELPNMLIRDEAVIAQKLGALGITNDHKVIFYDNSDLHTSCRALWMLRVFGHHPNQLYILDGGYAAWERYGGKHETGEVRSSTKTYTVNFQAQLVRTLTQMKTNLHHPAEQVVDVRHPVRYAGGPEARPGMRAGHIPNSISFPYFTMFEADGTFKPIDRIQKQLVGIGVNLDAPITSTCGSGVTSAILNFILDLSNHPHHALYDGSWSEWGADRLYPGEENLSERPVATSLEK